MRNYTYRVKNELGKVTSGELKANSVEDLKSQLREKGYSSIDVREKKPLIDFNNIKLFKKGVPLKELSITCRQFAIILEAGVPIATALDVLRTQCSNETLKETLNDIHENMQKGIALSNAMKLHKSIFPPLLIHMIEAGEISGKLEEVFARMADNYEKEDALIKKVKGAMTYPVIVIVIATLVIFVLMIKVVPSFVDILGGFNVELPLITRILVSVSDVFKNYWYIMIGGLAAAIFAIRSMIRTESGRERVDATLLKIPVMGGIITKIITARFTRTLSVLLASGVLLIQSMEVVQKIVGNVVVEKKIGVVIDSVKKGKGLFVPMQMMKFFPPMVISMVKIGEESGELDYALKKCADFYDSEVETSLASATALIEPTVMILMAILVGFIVVSVLSPMLSIYNTMSG